MKTLLIALLSLTTTLLISQNTVTWIGGTPGKENKWNEPRNWSDNHVPDEFSFVIVKYANSGHQAQPVIDSYVEVASVEIWSMATLTLTRNAQLVINGDNTFSEGIEIYGGHLVNNGAIHLNNLEVEIPAELLETINNNGQIYINGRPLGTAVQSDLAGADKNKTHPE